MRRFVLLILLLAFAKIGIAQYFPVFSQYISNGLIINPAFAGSRDILSLNLVYRMQMVGFNGSPRYTVFSAHSPLKNENIGLGLMVFDEKIGPLHNSHIYANYAYRLRIGEGRLSLGLKTGVDIGTYNWGQVYTNDPTDPAFLNEKQSFIMPNIGAGVFYFSRHFFAGLSVPYFLTYTESKDYKKISFKNDVNLYNFLFTSGYLFSFSQNFKFKPSLLIKYLAQSQEQIDLNATFILFNNRLSLGAAYRLKEALVGSFELQLNPQFRLSYSYEYAGKIANFFNYTSHEIGLKYEFEFKIKASNPRYF